MTTASTGTGSQQVAFQIDPVTPSRKHSRPSDIPLEGSELLDGESALKRMRLTPPVSATAADDDDVEMSQEPSSKNLNEKTISHKIQNFVLQLTQIKTSLLFRGFFEADSKMLSEVFSAISASQSQDFAAKLHPAEMETWIKYLHTLSPEQRLFQCKKIVPHIADKLIPHLIVLMPIQMFVEIVPDLTVEALHVAFACIPTIKQMVLVMAAMTASQEEVIVQQLKGNPSGLSGAHVAVAVKRPEFQAAIIDLVSEDLLPHQVRAYLAACSRPLSLFQECITKLSYTQLCEHLPQLDSRQMAIVYSLYNDRYTSYEDQESEEALAVLEQFQHVITLTPLEQLDNAIKEVDGSYLKELLPPIVDMERLRCFALGLTSEQRQQFLFSQFEVDNFEEFHSKLEILDNLFPSHLHGFNRTELFIGQLLVIGMGEQAFRKSVMAYIDYVPPRWLVAMTPLFTPFEIREVLCRLAPDDMSAFTMNRTVSVEELHVQLERIYKEQEEVEATVKVLEEALTQAAKEKLDLCNKKRASLEESFNILRLHLFLSSITNDQKTKLGQYLQLQIPTMILDVNKLSHSFKLIHKTIGSIKHRIGQNPDLKMASEGNAMRSQLHGCVQALGTIKPSLVQKRLYAQAQMILRTLLPEGNTASLIERFFKEGGEIFHQHAEIMRMISPIGEPSLMNLLSQGSSLKSIDSSEQAREKAEEIYGEAQTIINRIEGAQALLLSGVISHDDLIEAGLPGLKDVHTAGELLKYLKIDTEKNV